MDFDRIKQLAEQAGFKSDNFGSGIWDSAEFQQFVQLLIRECAWEIAEHYHPRYSYEHHVSSILAEFLISISETKK